MKNLFRLSCLLFVGVPVVLAAPVWAQSAPDECGRSPIDYADEEGLTLAEKIRRMDRALARSLNRYDECQEPRVDKRETENEDSAEQGAEAESGGGPESDNPSGNGESVSALPGGISGDEAALPPSESEGVAGGQAGSAQGGLEGDDEGEGASANAGSSSTAAGDIAGDEPDPAQQARTSGAGRQQNPEEAGQASGSGDGTVAGTRTRVLNNGKLPEDIPPSDNDSVLEGQIRQAAIDEPDPELKKKLWNEYRRYKGLPQVK